MNSVLAQALRRLRPPLILIVVIYAVSVAGLALIPGVDAEGRVQHLTIFQAFYFVSYTATTIGFGEIPFAFTDTQRLWVTLIVYSSVIGWTFLLGGLIALSQDKGFQHALTTARFERMVRGVGAPFYLVCGVGETGLSIARALDKIGMRCVIVDIDERRVQEVELEELSYDPPVLAGDARLPETLRMAGLHKPQCQGVLALSKDDSANLAIATAVHLLAPRRRVIARCHGGEAEESLRTLGIYHVINPFEEFAERLMLAMEAPNRYRLRSWLTGLPGSHVPPTIPAAPGRWIICGYGRFGAEIGESVRLGGFDVSIIDPHVTHVDGAQVARGRADVALLDQAGLAEAEGIVAGTDDDSVNLLIAIAARRRRPDIFLILRQNQLVNKALFERARADMIMVSSEVIANECMAILRTPLVGEFIAIVQGKDEAWADDVVRKLDALTGGTAPNLWSVALTRRAAAGLLDVMTRGSRPVLMRDLCRDVSARDERMPILPLLVMRGETPILLPPDDFVVASDDEILFAGSIQAEASQSLLLGNANVAHDVILDDGSLSGLVWRKLKLGARRTKQA